MVDRIDGPFKLEIDWIGVYYDQSHFEQYAFEEYQLPVQPLYTSLWSFEQHWDFTRVRVSSSQLI